MITVKRYDYPQRTITHKDGRTKIKEAYYTCYYHFEARQIAEYDSKYDTLYLSTYYISSDKTMSIYNRALAGKYKEAYAYLFEMLGIDETSKISEFMDI